MKKLLIGILLFLLFQNINAQVLDSDTTKLLSSLCFPVDTIYTKDVNSLTINIKWMDSIIQIRKTTRIKYNIDGIRNLRKDTTYMPSSLDTLRANEMRKSFSQNCHSYAFQKLFEYEGFIDNFLFTEWTYLTENKFVDNILFTSFKRTSSFKIRAKKCKDYKFEIGSIIVFRNEWNTPIHTVYYDGKFHSKYGGWPSKAEDDVESVLRTYKDSRQIEEYRLDYEKISYFMKLN